MIDWKVKLEKESIFFVAPDIKRGLGFEGILPNFHLVCSYSDPVIKPIRESGANVFCLEETIGDGVKNINNSGKLLQNEHVLNYIRQQTTGTPYIAFFKPSVKLDMLIAELGFSPIGNTADKNEKFENKVLMYKFMQDIVPDSLIHFLTGKLASLNYDIINENLGDKLVVQFGHGWAGKTTYFVSEKKEFDSLKNKFGETTVRVSKYINGVTLLNNCCIYQNNIFVGPPALQVSGIPLLSDNPSVTCGRQWPAGILTDIQIQEIARVSGEIGKSMKKNGYRGIFGIDFLIEDQSGEIYLSEINARLTASTSFYTKTELGLGAVPLMAYHFAAFMAKDISVKSHLGERGDGLKGSQLILRKDYSDSRISNMGEFGVYRIGQSEKIRDQYYQPEVLGHEEFIYIKRRKKNLQGGEDEFSRIETKEEIMANGKTLKKWVTDLLAAKHQTE